MADSQEFKKVVEDGKGANLSKEEMEAMLKASSGELTAEQQAIIEEFDREQKVRKFDGMMQKFYYWTAALIGFWHLYCCAFGGPVTLVYRSMHVAFMVALGFLLYPISRTKKHFQEGVPWYDWLLIALSLAVPVYMAVNYIEVVNHAGNPTTVDTIMATLLMVTLLEATRRVSGLPLIILSVVFILYGLLGRMMPVFRHRGYNWEQLLNHLFANTEGIYGTSVDVSVTYIFLFIMFGAVMNKSGMGQFFNDIALALAGASRGGPAKVSVCASAFLGSINGSAVANVVTTGAFTIPLMKKTGYSKEFAGAVESAASVGGQILPPVMGAAAFIMAEMLGMKYYQITIAAAIPAVLYYLGVILQVHYRACRMGLKGVSRDNLPAVGAVMKENGHLCLPILFLLYMLFFSSFTIIYAAFWSILFTVAISWVKKETRMSFKDCCDALVAGTKETCTVALACATVGIIVGVISKTGFGLNLANAILEMGGHSLFLTLMFTMVTCMVLGMGVPSIPAYIITATMAAPALSKLGIPELASHMFVFYFGMFANITPPVALASFAAAGLSGGDPMKTGWQSMKLAVAGFIVPFMFIYCKELLLIGAGTEYSYWHALQVAVTAIMGVILIASAIEGWMFTVLPMVLRAAAGVAALLLIHSGLLTDLIGLAVFVACVAQQIYAKKKEAA